MIASAKKEQTMGDPRRAKITGRNRSLLNLLNQWEDKLLETLPSADDEALRERMKLWGLEHIPLTLPIQCGISGADLTATPWTTAHSDNGATLMICLPCTEKTMERTSG
jgi:hypothetical protein